jgi:alkylation response protein AidB-like acyl-CoA dehydrogenase
VRAFALTPEQERLRDEARSVATADLAAVAAGGEPGRVNRDLLGTLWSSGLLPRLFPRSAGGARDDDRISSLELCLLREGLAQGSTEAETALAMQGLGGYPILQSGTPEQVAVWIPRIAAGDAVAAFALTEPEHGSDAGAIELKAEPDGDGWRLTGTKTYISNAPDADVYTLFARTTPDAAARGVTAFVVAGEADGVSGAPQHLVSDHPIGTVVLDGVRAEVLGEVDRGFRVAMRTLDLFRPSVGAFAVGMAQRALDLAVDHASQREAFGQRLKDFQAVSHRLAEMATRLEAARLLVYAAAERYDADPADPGITRASAMAKLHATEVAQWVVDGAVQILGARGLERGHPLEHLYRDVRAPRIYEGTSEIQRSIVARELYRNREETT